MSKRIRGLKPTINQATILQQNGMDYRDWLIKKVYSDRLECIHRVDGHIKPAFNVVAR